MVGFGWNFALLFLGWIHGVYFSFFQNFHFYGRGHNISPKRGWEAGDFKNGRIWLKFCTLVPWVNTWGSFNIFSKFSFLRAWSQFFAKTRLGGWVLQKWLDLAEILHTCSLSEYLGVFFHISKIFIFKGVVTSLRQNKAGRLETSKMVGFGWNFAHLILGWIPDGVFFHFFKIFIFKGVVTRFNPKRG